MNCPRCRNPLPQGQIGSCPSCGHRLGGYSRRFSRRYPGLFVILLDRSGSMQEEISDLKCSKAEFATTAINDIIYALLNNARIDRSGTRRKYAYVSVLGYNSTVTPLIASSSSGDPVDVPSLETRSFVKGTVSKIDPSGNSISVPYWIEPRAEDNTEMAEAFKWARDVIKRWLKAPAEKEQAERKYSFPPIIINITDAQINYGDDPLSVALDIQRSGTEDGNTLIFNCHFATDLGQMCIFPSDRNEVSRLDRHGFATQMFEMSSVIPEVLRKNAYNVTGGRDVPPDARGFVYNAQYQQLVWGTEPAKPENV